MNLPEGLVAVVKRDCPTCVLIGPVLTTLEQGGLALTVYAQDEPTFPWAAQVIDDQALEASFKLGIETVPTLIRVRDGREVARCVGWQRDEWEALCGVAALGATLPAYRPGCGSRSVEPGVAERLAVRHGAVPIAARRVTVPPLEDAIELCFERGWSDGLPVVPPTEERVYRMLQGTRRAPSEILGLMPPNLSPCPVEKVAINAVLAGCKPEYLPVVIAAVEAALDPAFSLHGLLATTWMSGPMIIVNGPIRAAIGMNWQGNVLGQGNRANACIGRALQLVVRNVGGGRPQEVDQSTFGSPAKYTCCFAEDETTPWTTLAQQRGFSRDQSCVTLFSADGPFGCADQKSRTPETLVQSLAGSLRAVTHAEVANAADAVVVIGPEHGRVFDNAGWGKADVVAALHAKLEFDGQDLGMDTANTHGPDSAVHVSRRRAKFRPEGLTLVRAGGPAGLFSVIIPGWLMKGALGTDPVTKEIHL